jgi:3-methyl-2-oxobutanoate hydroxymethyltransferase
MIMTHESAGQDSKKRRKTTILDLMDYKARGRIITMLTAYDYSSALLVDKAAIDVILVGDSLGMVMLGLNSTVPVTMDEMIHHCRAVERGASYALLVGDMPFMSYQADSSDAIRNAGRFLQEGMMDAVKLEGGREVVDKVEAIVDAGIPVMGHIGLTPQSISKLGGYKVQGKTAKDALRLLDDALRLEDAGCFSMVLEAVPEPVAETISRRLQIPTIGIGAGAGCDGQVLVYHDLLGLFDRFTPKFVKQYADAGQMILNALTTFADEVVHRDFPSKEYTYDIDQEELDNFLSSLSSRS